MASARAKSFEEEALKHVQSGDTEALKEFLFNKLDAVHEREVTQVTLITIWLIEILLNLMTTMKALDQTKSDKFKLLEVELKSILLDKKVQHCLKGNQDKVLELIASHGDEDIILFAATELKDSKSVLQFLIQRKRFDDAFDVLRKEVSFRFINPLSYPIFDFIQKVNELIYEFAPILMSVSPKKMVSLLVEKGRKIDPVKIVPTLVQEGDKSGSQTVSSLSFIMFLPTQTSIHCITKLITASFLQKQEIIRYLEYCLFNLKFDDQVLHNYLLALYASIDEKKLQEFLDFKPGDDDDCEDINYDPKYILRICNENPNLKAASVLIYTKMGLLEEAIDLALEFDVDLAKKIADKTSESDEELQRKLWLKIGKKVVSSETDMQKITEFLLETNDLLQIADILPFFSDFTSIEHFKGPICESLEVYHSTINELKEEMKEAAENLKEIKNEVESLKNKHSVVRTSNSCDLCDEPILLKPFHVFPCNHLFHSNCLIVAIEPHLNPNEVKRIKDIQRMLNPTPTHAPSSGSFVGGIGSTAASMLVASSSKFGSKSQTQTTSITVDARDKLITELNDLIASECIFCGEMMISTIDQPFTSTSHDFQSSDWD